MFGIRVGRRPSRRLTGADHRKSSGQSWTRVQGWMDRGSGWFPLKSGVFFSQTYSDLFELIRTLFTSTRLFASTAQNKLFQIIFTIILVLIRVIRLKQNKRG